MEQTLDGKEPLSVVVLGASGMLGSAVVRDLSRRDSLSVRGVVRDIRTLPGSFKEELGPFVIDGIDVTDHSARAEILAGADVVLNAVGVIKQASGLSDRAATVQINSLLPHQLAAECGAAGTRFVHVSTDCVFSGRTGSYEETSVPDPVDFYGRSKLLGEVEEPALTLRTSIIGHEVHRHASLVDWFLTRDATEVNGFVNAIYSGVPTTEFASLFADVVLPRHDLKGLYHVASDPISKFDLLSLLADQYGWGGAIVPFEEFHCDRSMRADRLMTATGYRPPSWPDMIKGLHEARPPWAVGCSAEGSST